MNHRDTEDTEEKQPVETLLAQTHCVDEVARAKGQSYFTLVYDLSPGDHYGRILWIKEGRDSAVLLEFLDALSEDCADGIEAVALDMGPAYIAAVQASLPTSLTRLSSVGKP